jgi:hypothetical protein
VEKVDPLLKMLHKPTLEKMMKEAADDLDSLGKSQEALLFGIYFAVITRYFSYSFSVSYTNHQITACRSRRYA